ncbi:hypothetical protein [Paenibacillus montanisoli]|uniref:Uncharacterized protein n=1 Tax=Paenibacillus montanisoli TaxID=2081970 RepID=A0A328U490_9BACL|nr:hypothetical protein [Paenibacillus montanisoli]RAP74676.1 hypothetical protein DL346_21775 [Paenibacillus montanisoli]
MPANIHRFMWISAIKRGMEEAFATELAGAGVQLRKRLQRQGVLTCSVFREGRYLFTYLEAGGADSLWAWDDRLSSLLDAWPGIGERDAHELRMNDIFHDDIPLDDVPWRRPGYRPTQRVGSLAKLKPEQYASYVFLHYQLQEEQPRLFNKYYTIGSFGDYIFSYHELPAIVEPTRKGLLATSETPPDWGVAMAPHFEPWADDTEREPVWRVMEEIFSMSRD